MNPVFCCASETALIIIVSAELGQMGSKRTFTFVIVASRARAQVFDIREIGLIEIDACTANNIMKHMR